MPGRLPRLVRRAVYRRRAKRTMRGASSMTSLPSGVSNYKVSRSRGALNAISKNPGELPFPNKIIVRHRYAQTFTLDGTAGAASSFQIGLNDLYQPIAGGHQPMGFDQMAALYQKYKVLGVKVTATFANISNTLDTGNQYVGLQIHENSSYSPSYITQIVERGRCVYKLLGLANGGHDTAKLTMKWSAKDWYGKNNYSGQDVAGSISANPSESCYISIFSVADYDGQNPGACDCMIVLDYIVEWFGPLQMNQS